MPTAPITNRINNTYSTQEFHQEASEGNQPSKSPESNDYANIMWGTDGNDKLVGTCRNNVFIGGIGQDILIGGPGTNTFLFQSLKDSLLSSHGPDRIRNLKIGTDIIGGPNPVGAGRVVQAGKASKLTTRAIRRVLTNKIFAPGRAATFTVGKRTFLAINNNKAGFQAKGVALINITGYSGDLSKLAIAGPRSYADPNEQYYILESKDLLISESAGIASVQVARTGNALTRETLEYVVTGDSAIAGEDFISPTLNGRLGTGRVIFDVGRTTATIEIPIIDDNITEGTEVFAVGLQRTSNGTLLFPRTVNINIVDNDSHPRIGFLSTKIESVEDQESVAIRVVRQGRNNSAVSIDFTTTDGTALAGLDYIETAGTITFNPGEIEKIIQVRIVDNKIAEPVKSFSVSLYNAPSSIELFDSNTEVSILDDDQPLLSSLVRTNYASILNVIDLDWIPDSDYMFVAQKEGIVRLIQNGNVRDLPVLDIQDQVNNRSDRGLIGLAVHPDFYNQPYIYVGYTYDPPETEFLSGLAGRDGSGNRPSRVARVRIDIDTLTADLASFEVILGKNSRFPFFDASVDSTGDVSIPASGVYDENSLIPGLEYDKGFQDNDPDRDGIQAYNLRDYLATDSSSHSIGSLRFGPDGYLYVANGDGTSFNFPDPRTIRVQDPANLSGKILRIDPITGAGLANNPFFDGDADSNSSKVFYYGLRNPFRFSFDPVTGWPVVGDVGWNTTEEVNTGPPGSNFGWPYFEGNQQTQEYRFLPQAQAFYQNGNVNPGSPDQMPAVAPLISLGRSDARAVLVSDFYDENTFLYGDFVTGRFFAKTLNDDRSIKQVNPFMNVPPGTVVFRKGPDNLLYASDRRNLFRWEPDFSVIDPLS